MNQIKASEFKRVWLIINDLFSAYCYFCLLKFSKDDLELDKKKKK